MDDIAGSREVLLDIATQFQMPMIGWEITYGTQMGMDQYLLIPFLGGWTSIYQLFGVH